MAIVVSRALGGGTKDETGWSPPPKADPSTAPKTSDELEMVLGRALGGG